MTTPKLNKPNPAQPASKPEVKAPKINSNMTSVSIAEALHQGVNRGFDNFKNFQNAAFVIAEKKQKIAESDLNNHYQTATAKVIQRMKYEGKTYPRVEDVKKAISEEFMKNVSLQYAPEFIDRWRRSKDGQHTIAVSELESGKQFLSSEYDKQLQAGKEEARKAAVLSFTTGDGIYVESFLRQWLDERTVLTPYDKESVMNIARRDKDKAEVEKDINSNPEIAYKNLHEDTEKYASLTAPERAKYKDEAVKAKAGAKETSHNYNVRNLINFWAAQNEASPENANNFLQTATKKPNAFIPMAKKVLAEYGINIDSLDHKDVITFVNQAQAVVADSDQPNAMEINREFGLFEANFNKEFTDKDGKISDKITDKKKRNFDFIIGQQNRLIGMRNDGTYRTYNKQIDKMLEKTDRVILSMMNEKPESEYDRNSVSNFMIRRIYKMNDIGDVDVKAVDIINEKGRAVKNINAEGFKIGKKNRFFDDTATEAYFINEKAKPLPPEYMARIYSNAYNNLLSAGIDPSAIAKNNIEMIEQIIDDAFKQELIRYYNLPNGDFDAVLTQNSLVRYAINGSSEPIKIKGKNK